MRIAVVRNAPIDVIKSYLPENYYAVSHMYEGIDKEMQTDVIIYGHDHRGWTLHEYVMPRLESAMYFAKEWKPAGWGEELATYPSRQSGQP